MPELFRAIALLIAICAVSACSGFSNPDATGFRPNVADLISEPEPPIPDAAFEAGTDGEPTPAALDAERQWHDAMIIWGRDGWMTVDRICRAAKAKVPDLPVECRVPD